LLVPVFGNNIIIAFCQLMYYKLYMR